MKAIIEKTLIFNGERWSRQTVLTGSLNDIISDYHYFAHVHAGNGSFRKFTKHKPDSTIDFTFEGDNIMEEWVLLFEEH